MVRSTDAVLAGVFAFRKVCSHDAVVHHVDERSDTVPAFIIEPDLTGDSSTFNQFISFIHSQKAIKYTEYLSK